MFLYWLSRMRFSWSLTDLTHSCAVLSVVLRAVRDCGLLGCLSFGVYNKQLMATILKFHSVQLSSQQDILWFVHVRNILRMSTVYQTPCWVVGMQYRYGLSTQGLQSMGGGEGRQMPPQAQGSTMSATVGSSLGCGGSIQRRQLSHAQSSPGKDFWMK